MQSLKIVLLVLFAGIAYGIVHDQITARVCVEYFTIGHPAVFPTKSPTLLALGWGVLATWWVALLLGVALAIAARLGRRPKYTADRLLPSIAVLLASMAVVAAVSGMIAYICVRTGRVMANPWVRANIPANKQAAFMADWWSHSSSYLSGIVGGAILCIRVRIQRKKL